MRRQQDQVEQRDRELANQRADVEQKIENIEAEHQAQAEERRRIEDRELKLAQKEREASATVRMPAYWTHKTGFHRQPTSFVRKGLERFMHDSNCCSGSKAQIARIERIENELLWRKYQTTRDILHEELAAHGSSLRRLASNTRWQPDIPSTAELNAYVNEFYLFHGTSSKRADIIVQYGFDERVSRLDGLYGAGNYFANAACKSHQYSRSVKDSQYLVMLVCRVTMGSPYCTKERHPNMRRPPDNLATPGRPFDSIFAEGGVANGGDQIHNEFVVFDRNQIYPEFVIHYTV